MIKNILKISTFFIFFISILFFPSTIFADQSTPTWTLPSMQISIPTVKITQDGVKCTGDYCDIPWIGQYLAGIYKYAIGIVGIVAAIMLMIGGIVWLTAGGNASQVTDAKGYITGSLTGLILALLSYTILYTINPALVSFKPIRMKMVQKAPDAGGQNCSWTDPKQCDENFGYTIGSNCPDRPNCNSSQDGTVTPGCDQQVCCCTAPATAGCSWSNDATCGNNARQVSEYSKCGTNTGKLTTCCCDWPGADDAPALLSCIQSATTLGSGSIIGSPETNKQCCENWTSGCGHSQTRANSCHFGCQNGYKTQAIDWVLPRNKRNAGSCTEICDAAKAISAKCSNLIKGSILGPTYCPSCGGYTPYSQHDDHFHLSTKSCKQN